jgi:photosystem II stability/assembly factor-like uncharacterized protein
MKLFRRTLLVGAASLAVTGAAPAGASAATWNVSHADNSRWFGAIDCPTQTHCFAVGDAGRVRATSDSGVTWTNRDLPISEFLTGVQCPDIDTCWALAEGGSSASSSAKLYRTDDAGLSWNLQTTVASKSYYALSCTDTRHCWAGGGWPLNMRITSDGGASWTAATPTGGADYFWWLSCVGTTHCWGLSDHGHMLATTDGGGSWSTQSVSLSPPQMLNSVSCVSTTRCVATGTSGSVRVTSDGGSTWTSESSGTSSNLLAVDCATATSCASVAFDGTIRSRSGTTWSADASPTSNELWDVSCPTPYACFAAGKRIIVSTVKPTFAGSCTDPAGALFDGTVGGVELKLRTQPAGPGYPGRTWVCFRLSTPVGGEVVSGRIDIDAAEASGDDPTVDNQHLACSTTPDNSVPGPHPLADGLLAGQPFLVDVYSAAGKSWICLQIGADGRRVVVPVGTPTPGVTPHLD